MYYTNSGLKSVFVERFNKTMKGYFYERMTASKKKAKIR